LTVVRAFVVTTTGAAPPYYNDLIGMVSPGPQGIISAGEVALFENGLEDRGAARMIGSRRGRER